jgi:hypothetical protein
MDKETILAEIRRTADENDGKPLGRRRFEQETGIGEYDVSKHWARWGDALKDAGFEPQRLNGALSDDHVFAVLARVVRRLGHVPTWHELRVLHHRDPAEVPDEGVFKRRLGSTKSRLISTLTEYCEPRSEFADVLQICAETVVVTRSAESSEDSRRIGEVYLIRSGRYYKIGKTDSLGRRLREFQIQLPDAPRRIHSIRTYDPDGIEAYWHRRFADKRVRPNAEFFRLDTADVREFCAWKRIVR